MGCCVSGLDAPAVVAGLQDLGVVCDPIKQSGRHLAVAKDPGPFAEGQVGSDQQRRTLVGLGDQVEEELSAALGEGQVAQFAQGDQVLSRKRLRQSASPPVQLLLLQLVHQIHDIEVPLDGVARLLQVEAWGPR